MRSYIEFLILESNSNWSNDTFRDSINVMAQEFKRKLEGLNGVADLYVEPIVGGKYIDVLIRKKEIGRYGLSVDDINMFVQTALGGMNASTTIEARERFPINVRFAQDFRNTIRQIENHF